MLFAAIGFAISLGFLFFHYSITAEQITGSKPPNYDLHTPVQSEEEEYQEYCEHDDLDCGHCIECGKYIEAIDRTWRNR